MSDFPNHPDLVPLLMARVEQLENENSGLKAHNRFQNEWLLALADRITALEDSK